VKFLCAICIRRDADTMHELDGRHRPVCLECIGSPVPEPAPVRVGPREQTLRFIKRSPGVTFREIRDALDIPGCGHRAHNPDPAAARIANRYCKAVERLAIDGLVERRGKWPHWTYWPAEGAQ
jgi:hypothetical protein